jgi:hypothetical protein
MGLLVREDLERQVHEPAIAARPGRGRHHQRPVLGRDVFHGIDAEHTVERRDVCQLMEPGLLDRFRDATRTRLFDHAG